jgi:hypothetical protein
MVGTHSGEEFERTRKTLQDLGVWEEGSSPKQWHFAAIMALNAVRGNSIVEGDKAKLAFILAKNFDDAIDRVVAATRDLVHESHDNTKTMSRLQRWMIGLTIVYVLATAVGVYLSRQTKPPQITVQPAPVQILQPAMAPTPTSTLPSLSSHLPPPSPRKK